MKTTIIIFFALFSFVGFAQDVTKIDWSQLETHKTKDIEVEFFGMRQKMEWPVFESKTQELDGKLVELEGYYLCEKTITSMEDTAMTELCLITISNEYTTSICGVPAYSPTEFGQIDKLEGINKFDKITIRGILRLNTTGEYGTLFRIENAELIK